MKTLIIYTDRTYHQLASVLMFSLGIAIYSELYAIFLSFCLVCQLFGSNFFFLLAGMAVKKMRDDFCPVWVPIFFSFSFWWVCNYIIVL